MAETSRALVAGCVKPLPATICVVALGNNPTEPIAILHGGPNSVSESPFDINT
ncbi:MAG TPA: hypothetical protein VFE51_10985 [Verrucomicrobiae bacterium]|nr:hypothetical protein [Verrucomicrobiae bacterium]